MGRVVKLHGEEIELPLADNSSEALKIFRAANERFREVPWPAPYSSTNHELRLGDARNLSFLEDASVHLVVTSPPYWTLKQYEGSEGQMGDVEDYEEFLDELDKVWRECARVLVPGGRIVCVVGDVCVPRKKGGRHYVMPLHADIQVRARGVGLDCLTPIMWHKIANGVTEAEGNGAGFYGKPYQPGAVVKNDIEYILFMRKGGGYRKVDPLQKALSMLTKQEMQSWWRSIWTDIRGASTRRGHPAPYPPALAERLIRMFSFAGDIVLDPFGGTGSTAVAALNSGRNSISLDIESAYIDIARSNLTKAVSTKRKVGAIDAHLIDVTQSGLNKERNCDDVQGAEKVSVPI
ncbi:site-specific DNA-methyltransferase [Erythrobacter sp. HKB08]|uniref:DNA-methyltransferase n=1 Tax=Erythrobacter sp. HKB08 TaxID=2502843 RepID=UPI001008FDBE|nr:site-specific DNA-methyltransferase [Erythrobacter sp. HKB08]